MESLIIIISVYVVGYLLAAIILQDEKHPLVRRIGTILWPLLSIYISVYFLFYSLNRLAELTIKTLTKRGYL